MKNENFITVLGWMVNELGLKGNDLLIYAIIYGFSQDGESEFSGSNQYLREAINVSKNTVIKSLKNLEEANLVERVITENFGQTFNTFRICKGGAISARGVQTLCEECQEVVCECQNLNGGVQKLHGGGSETAPNSITNNIDNNIVNNILNKSMSEIEISDFETEEDKKYFQVAKAFHDLFIKNLKDKKISAKKIENTNGMKFIAQIRLMYQRDECTDEQFRDVFKFLNSPAGDFWTTNILSTKKLREKFTTLLLQNGRKQNQENGISDDPAEKTRTAIENYVRESAEGS